MLLHVYALILTLTAAGYKRNQVTCQQNKHGGGNMSIVLLDQISR